MPESFPLLNLRLAAVTYIVNDDSSMVIKRRVSIVAKANRHGTDDIGNHQHNLFRARSLTMAQKFPLHFFPTA